MTNDPSKSAAADLVAATAAFNARSHYVSGYRAGQAAADADEARLGHVLHLKEEAEQTLAHVRAEGARALEEATAALVAAESRIAVEASRADVAEQRVCELRARVLAVVNDRAAFVAGGLMRVGAGIQAALGSTADIAGRWVPRQHFDDIVDGYSQDRAVAESERDAAIADRNRACDARESAERARDEVGIQYAAAQERLRLAMGLRDFAESPPIHWDIAEDRQTMTSRLDDATATLAVDGRVEIRLDDGVLLARIDVHAHDGPVSGVLMDRAESQCEIAAALLWSHRRSNRLDAVRAWDTVPGDALAKVGTMNGVPIYVDPALPDGYVRRVPPSPAGASVQPTGGGLRAIALSHLEALGIDTSNVKGGE